MNEGILYTLAGVATTLGGFSGVVIVLRPQGTLSWSSTDLRYLWFFVGDSFLVVMFALLPIPLLLMGLAAAGEISALLIERGWSGTTPAAIVRGASTVDAETWSGTLVNLAAGVEESDGDRPGTIVIGEVVRVGALLAAVDADDEDVQEAAAR